MKKILILILFFGLNALGTVRELNSFADLDISGWDTETIVVFDIDNTLIRQDQMIGTHQWGDYFHERAMRRGVPEDKARSEQYKAFAEVQPFVKVIPVESRVVSLLNTLETRHIEHLALTARSAELRPITLMQLQVVHHDFEKNFPKLKDESLFKDVLEKGVIFATGRAKGELLKSIVENSIKRPKRIVFIDDKLYNLESVEKSFKESNIILDSYRYGAADGIVAGFDPKLADVEYSFLKELKLLISDSEATKISNDSTKIIDLRFEKILTRQGSSVNRTGKCEELIEVARAHQFRCPYIFDRTLSLWAYFDLKQDSYTQGFYFGDW